MITRQFPVDLSLQYSFGYDIDKIVFFDIESTGFSAETTYLYLIGCIYYKDASFHLIQWFSEGINEEADIITSFFEFIKDYDALIHYNGSGFDIPYLNRKCSMLKLDYDFDAIDSLDIYKLISPYKKLFKLGSFKQKSIEVFLNINREDIFDGGDLIQVYQSYLGKKHIETLRNTRNPKALQQTPSEADILLHQLLLHNEDDIKGLVSICPILSYVDIFEKPIHIVQAGVDGDILTIRFELFSNIPVRVSFGNASIYFTALEKKAALSIHIYDGELKYFYDNYKDYYYLPAEDSAVHKSLALFVDKEYRVKAKPSNCYTKKSGLFAPQYETLITPSYKHSYQDKLSFIEIHTDFLLKEKNLELYVSHILSHMINLKE
ncbi:MAG TPA: ribonuclease H-like domain-containing protein [Mobilitalea sp.]|nr:ribonuclease H-like domain-containing protein [Mobilitalea sp.]